MKNKKVVWILLGNLVALFILYSEAGAQIKDTRGYIYGKVTTFDNEYIGQIRWGKEEAFWNDYFNATKTRDDYYERIAREKEEKKSKNWEDFDWDFSSIWEDKYYTTHEFKCQFGDLAAIEDIGRDRLSVRLKNGVKLRLSGGSNDVGATVRMYDNELGQVSIKWDRIEKVEFFPTPKGLRVQGGDPIYGTVETYRKGTFTGFIQWDHDERLGEDKLDGDTRSEDVSIEFKHIGYIERQGNGCHVALNSGREFYLDGSNDVDDGNRGIIVSVPGVGKIDIPWKYFRSATFEPAPNSGPGYDEYTSPKGIFGTVYTLDGEELSGKLVYDIDETWELETLDGRDDEVDYLIAFRHVKAIIPKNYAYSMIELKNGDQILLGDSRDVSDENDGILVFKDPSEEPYHIPWKKIAEIVLD